MANQLTYSEITDLCAEKRITVTNLAKSTGMTLHGLKAGVQKQTLQSQVVFTICNLLGITPNRFFNWDEEKSTYSTNQVGVVNNQNIGTSNIELLHQQLAVKDEQIKQLQQLLNKVLDNQ